MPTLLLLASIVSFPAAQPEIAIIDLQSDFLGFTGLPMAESKLPIYRITLSAQIDKEGNGKGELILDPSRLPEYDELGFPGPQKHEPAVKLACTIHFQKNAKRVYTSLRLGADPREAVQIEENWTILEIKGPPIKSKLTMAVNQMNRWSAGRLLIHEQGKVKYVIEMQLPPQPPPCHPGCFPAGTLIAVPGGTRTIESLWIGDIISTLAADGFPQRTKITSVFVTTNRLFEVRTDVGTLLTTETQPLALDRGGIMPVGEMKAGDRIFIWKDGTRSATTVRDIQSTQRSERVFNLVLGEPVLFIANGFLARSKPPAPSEPPQR